ncbi:MAG: tetratricopeptide repeat protein [Bacteroidota bacterium]
MRSYCFLFMALLLQIPTGVAQEKDSTVVALEENVANATNDSLKVDAYLTLGDYQLRRDFNRVLEYLNKVQQILETTDQQFDSGLQKANAFQQYGLIARRRGNFTDAIRYYYKALPIFEKYNDSIGLASSFNNIGNVLIYQEEYEKAKKILKKAIAINTKLKRPKSIGNNYNILTRAYQPKVQPDSLQYILDKATAYYTEANYEEGIYQILSKKSALYVVQKRYEEALNLQLKNLEYVKSIQRKMSISTAHYNLARIYIKLKAYTKALFHINQAIVMSKSEKLGRQYALAFRRRSLIYNLQKDYYNALEDYRRYAKAYDSIYNINKAKEIREIELSHSFEKARVLDSIQFEREKEVLLLKTENEALQKKWYLSLLVFMSLAVIAIVYFGGNYLKKLRLRKQLEAKELHTKIDQLSTEISTKTEEISGLMAETIIHLNTKEKITENLNKLSKHEEGISLSSILAELKADKLEDSKLVVLKENIEKINYEFIKKLREKHTNLTKTDIEVCSFIKLGLSRKEIATLRCTSTEAVKKSRYRLRKKMALPPTKKLEKYRQSN